MALKMIDCGYMAMRTKPTLKQERFARAYVVDGNATEAVVQAGYDVKDRNSAATVGTENLRKPQVARAIQDWRQFLEAEVMPSLETIRTLRDNSEDGRLRLAASRDLLNRAGAGKQQETKTPIVAVFANMDESVLIDKMMQLAGQKSADTSKKVIDVSPNIQCATEKKDGVGGFGAAAAE